MSRKWDFTTPRTEGTAPRQAHTAIPQGLWERELGRDGFSGPSVEFYHRNPPSAWSALDGDIRPHLLSTADVGASSSPWDAAEMFANGDVRARFWRTQGNMDHVVKNADGDELLFVHRGAADLYCDFGHIALVQGDYFVMPRGTQWRIEAPDLVEMLLIESTNSAFSLARQPALGRHIPIDPGMLDVPAINASFKDQVRDRPVQVRIKRDNQLGILTYPFNPLDAEGWQGDLYPIRLNIADLRPIHSFRGHLVPSAYTTFVSEHFVVCTFTPYPSPTDPESLKLPSFHDNIDYDEVMFMHEGSKTHRISQFQPGTFTYHPQGLPHGPHPQALEHFHRPTAFPLESTFVMIDTRRKLSLGKDAGPLDVPGYSMSWAESIAFAPDAASKPEAPAA